MSTDKSQTLRDFNQLRVLAALGEMADPDTGLLPDKWPEALSKRVNLPEYDAVQVAIPHGTVDGGPWEAPAMITRPWHLTDAGRLLCKYAQDLQEAVIVGHAQKEIAWLDLSRFYEKDPKWAQTFQAALIARRQKDRETAADAANAAALLDTWAEGDEAEQKETLAVLKGAAEE